MMIKTNYYFFLEKINYYETNIRDSNKKKKSMALINIEVITVRELGILIIEMSHGARDIY